MSDGFLENVEKLSILQQEFSRILGFFCRFFSKFEDNGIQKNNEQIEKECDI
jgi:hypothetical protein